MFNLIRYTRYCINKGRLLTGLMTLCANVLTAQTVVLEAQVVDSETKLPIPQMMIVNKRTNVGVFGDNNGNFKITLLQKDTLILSMLGYKMRNICLKDSVVKSSYKVNIALEKIYFTLKEIHIYPVRNLNAIEQDLKNVGVKNTYTTQGIAGVESPITFLYERFSKFAKSQQKVAVWENEDLKRSLLKELFRLYIRYDIIALSDAEFDAFIKYLNFSDEFMRTSTQLELVLAIKGKYETFKTRWK